MQSSKLALEQLVDRVMAELEKRIAPRAADQDAAGAAGTGEFGGKAAEGNANGGAVGEKASTADVSGAGGDKAAAGGANDDSAEAAESEADGGSFGVRASHVPHPKWEEGLTELLASTPARIGVWRAGTRPLTRELLKFRYDHAAAVDSIYGTVSQPLLDRFGLFTVETCYGNTENYLKRPDQGRIITEEGAALIRATCKRKPQVQIVVSDGLSANAVSANLEDVYMSLIDSLRVQGLAAGTPFFVRGGRVAVMDHIGELLEPEALVLLIGERPGLVSSKSLSAYMCYRPRLGTVESSRTVLSNIHEGGTPPVEAGAHIGTIVRAMLEQRTSGVHLDI
ncbi:ethanolamine ammonia-lyase subunit EutC [Paenibacillus montanisoli]|uniref:Ethanolamine ammonia-lyase small subunit n=1 Tax=Paenibacillus montanisoli TaxID=2081970 RepID=A0A328TXB3_9BACL|nr:ethanolamine ammonia-lyase subunit EutC [Paenibacillus montanisoli]RAP75070.1 ethanolamine ammonia-lyase [Paenibacillus montanisoli]